MQNRYAVMFELPCDPGTLVGTIEVEAGSSAQATDRAWLKFLSEPGNAKRYANKQWKATAVVQPAGSPEQLAWELREGTVDVVMEKNKAPWPDGFVVRVVATGALAEEVPNRREIYAWAWGYTQDLTPAKKRADQKLFERLRRCILAGKAFGPATLKNDVNGNTYVQAHMLLYSKALSAELKKRGF